MKILHIIPSLDMGGAERLVSDMLPIMKQEKDIDISVAIFNSHNSSFEKKLRDNNIDIIYLDTPLRSLRSIPHIIDLLKKFDIVHAHLFPINYLVAIANLFVKKPIVFTEHSTFNKRRQHKWLKPIEKLIYSRYSVLACISEEVATALERWIGNKIARKRLTIIHNGINLTNFEMKTPPEPEKIFGRKGIPLVMISRFSKPKDHPTVVRALKLINREEVFVVFVGDGERKEEIKQLTERLKVSDRVVFLGLRSDIPEIAHSSYIGVQASNWEGFGLTAVEIMASGIPVIASNVNGLAQVVGEAGVLFKKGDEVDLASKITSLIDDRQLYEDHSAKSKKRAKEYSIHNTVYHYIQLYRSLCP